MVSKCRINTSLLRKYKQNAELAFLFTLCRPMASAANLCKQFRPRSGPANPGALSGPKLFDILMVLPNDFFEKVDFAGKICRRQKKSMQNLNAGGFSI